MEKLYLDDLNGDIQNCDDLDSFSTFAASLWRPNCSAKDKNLRDVEETMPVPSAETDSNVQTKNILFTDQNLYQIGSTNEMKNDAVQQRYQGLNIQPNKAVLGTGDVYMAGARAWAGGGIGHYRKVEALISTLGDRLTVETSSTGGGFRPEMSFNIEIEGIEISSYNHGKANVFIITNRDGSEKTLKGHEVHVDLSEGKSISVVAKDGLTTIKYPNGDSIELDMNGIKSITRSIQGIPTKVERDKFPEPSYSVDLERS